MRKIILGIVVTWFILNGEAGAQPRGLLKAPVEREQPDEAVTLIFARPKAQLQAPIASAPGPFLSLDSLDHETPLALPPVLPLTGDKFHPVGTIPSGMAPAAIPVPTPRTPPARVWFSAEYILWLMKSSPVPTPLVTVGDGVGLGRLGAAGTQVIYGGRSESLGGFSGLRMSAGVWLDQEQQAALEASGFFLERRTQIFSARSDAAGNPIFATPIFDATLNAEGAYITSFPGFATGVTAVHNSSRLFGYEFNLALNVRRTAAVRADFLIGYRNLQLDERLEAFQRFTILGPGFLFAGGPAAPGDVMASYDRFGTRNQFNGGQVGGRVDWTDGLLTVGVTAKVALGATHQTVDIDGGSFLIKPTLAQTTAPGGIFALPSNMGGHSRDVFSVVPEVGFNVGLRFTERLRGYVGYNFLYICNVARPGNQIDRAVNVNNVPTDNLFGTPGGPARPAFTFHNSDYWAQGVNIGLNFQY